MGDVGGLPDVSVMFKPGGVAEVLKAFKTVEQAAIDASRRRNAEDVKAQRASEGIAKAEADAIIRERKRIITETERAQRDSMRRTDAFGNTIRGGDRGLRQISSSRAFEDILGKTVSGLIGLHGPMGAATAAFGLLKSGIGFATAALSQFGGYVLNDIIRPQLDLGTKATQMANRMGGGATGAGVASAINGLYATNAQAELEDVQKVFDIAADKTKDLGKAKQVSDLALTANKAYGYDASKMAEFIGNKRAAYSDLSEADFGRMINAQLAALTQGSGTAEDFAGQAGRMDALALKFATGGNPSDKIARDTEISSLVAASTGKGGSAATAVTGLTNLMNDLQRDPGKFGATLGDGQFKRLDAIIPELIAKSGGNLNAYGAGKKEGPLAGVQIGALSASSLGFLRNLGLDETYRKAEGEHKGSGTEAVQAQLHEIFDQMSSGAKLAEDAAQVEADTGYQLDAAFRAVNVTLMQALIPMLQEHGPKIASALKGLADDLKDVDIVGILKAAAVGMATALYYLVDFVSSLPGVDSGKLAGVKGTLGKAAGIGTKEVSGAEADKMLHPGEDTGLFGKPSFDAYDPNSKNIVNRYMPGLAGVMSGVLRTTEHAQDDPLHNLKSQWAFIEKANQQNPAAVKAATGADGSVDIKKLVAALQANTEAVKSAGAGGASAPLAARTEIK